MAWLLSSSSTKRFSGTTESLCLMLLALALNLFFLECWWWAIGASTPCLARVFRMIWFSIFRKNLFATPCLYPLLPSLFCCPAFPPFFDTPCCAGFALLHRECKTPHALFRQIAPHCRLPSQRYTSHTPAHAHNSPAHALSAHCCALYTSNGPQHGDAFPLVNGLFLTSLRPQMCQFSFPICFPQTLPELRLLAAY